jgi:uncharacterized protein (DUF2267 family)
MDAGQFVKRICERTGFDRERSGLLVRTTLVTLGTRISPGEADDLAAQLPNSFAGCLQHGSEPCRFGPDEFKRRVARIIPLATDQAGPAVKAVFGVLAEAVSEGELRQVLGQLGADYEPLAGMATGQAAQH